MTAFTFYVGAMLLFENWIAMQLWWRYRANDVETAFDL